MPGPGAYETSSPSSNRKYFQENKSWQFQSQTKRAMASLSKSYNFKVGNGKEEGEGEEKIKSIHSRHNLLQP